ncbi:hypothetical protein GLOIN_2v1786477 [Rhizophagus irregularis DAOM 181602=DAOM 197198]|nr:hypothetical protein GLOIN_2v1786477 [Rhizophagus irregularis DAOM 181602=DAOM 197198]
MHMNGNVVAQMLHENVLRRIDTGVRWSELLQLAYFNPSHLSVHDQKILHHFVRICTVFISQILEFDAVRESYERLIKIVKLIEEHYGRDKITPNLHLSLYLSECMYDFRPLYTFWYFSFKRMNSILVTGSESFPGEMLCPASENVVMSNLIPDLLVEYYLATYKTLEFQKPFGEGHKNSRIISVKMKQFGRCRISSETFGSNMSARYIKNSYVLAKFITQDGSIDCYPRQVQFFFSHKVDLPDGELEHNLAFIRWY